MSHFLKDYEDMTTKERERQAMVISRAELYRSGEELVRLREEVQLLRDKEKERENQVPDLGPSQEENEEKKMP